MSTITIQGHPITIQAKIDTNYSAAVDYLLVGVGPMSLGIFNAAERKAFIRALQDADTELYMASLRDKKEVAA